MNELVIMHDRQAVTTSLRVSEAFNKQHKDVLEAIRELISSAENSALLGTYFTEGEYKASNGKANPMYYMNRDGFSLLAMGFTGSKAMQFKLQYIEAFNAMESTLKKVPAKKLDPVLQAELAITRTNTAKANALFKIACKTKSETSKQALLAKAAEAITGEMTIPVLLKKEYSATAVAQKLGTTANKVGRTANQIGIKAEQPGQNKYGRWANSKSQHSDKEVPQWLYFDEGVKAIAKAINSAKEAV